MSKLVLSLRADSDGIKDLAGHTGITTDTCTLVDGKFGGKAISAKLITITNSDIFIPAETAFTFSVWIKITNASLNVYKGAYTSIIGPSTKTGDGSDTFMMGEIPDTSQGWVANNENFHFCGYGKGYHTEAGSIKVSYVGDNLFHHLAFTYDGTAYKAFLDGTYLAPWSSYSQTPIGKISLNNGGATKIGGLCDMSGISSGTSLIIDDMCLIIGKSLWTDNFTPPVKYLSILNKIYIDKNNAAWEMK